MATARGMTGEDVGAFLEELSIIDGSAGTEVVCRVVGPDRIDLEAKFTSVALAVDFHSSLFGSNRFRRFKQFFSTH